MSGFFERAEPVFELYAQGDYAQALHLVDALALEFPDQAIHTSYWRMCLLGVSGQGEQALQVLEEAISHGLWWSAGRLREEPDLKNLQGNPVFENLVTICSERHSLAKAQAKAELLILEPDNANTDPHPLLLVLHGRDGSAERRTSLGIGAVWVG